MMAINERKEVIIMDVVLIVLTSILVVIVVGYLLLNLYIKKNFINLKLLYDVDESKKISIKKNIKYKKNGSNNQLMDIYIPEIENQEENFPAIFFLHGEGIEKVLKDIKEWSFYTSYGKLAASKGFVGITFHRSRTNYNFKHNEIVAKDILDAVDFVRSNASTYHIDKNRICIWSFSLGGLYLSLFLKDTPTYIRGLISYYGLLDVKFKVKKLSEEHNNYQPENYLPITADSIPPILIVKAKKDKIRGVNASQDHFIKIADQRHIPYQLISHSTGGHTFDALDDNAETTEIISKTWGFIQKNL